MAQHTTTIIGVAGGTASGTLMNQGYLQKAYWVNSAQRIWVLGRKNKRVYINHGAAQIGISGNCHSKHPSHHVMVLMARMRRG